MVQAKLNQMAASGFAVAFSLLMGSAALAAGQQSLVGLEQEISRDYPGVQTILPEQLDRLQREEDVLLIDVRAQSEYLVSHLPGAIRVEPDIGTAEFVNRLGDRAKGKLVVLYCSVGVRSSRLAERISRALTSSGAIGVFNLSGGIFSWHNTGRPVGGRLGEADLVHPYSRSWSYFLDFDNYTSFGAASRR